MTQDYVPGLEGIIAGQTKVSTIIEKEAKLIYRGYGIADLAEHSTFEEVAYLMLYGVLPTSDEFAKFKIDLVQERSLPDLIVDTLRKLPKGAHPMDYLRSCVSLLSAYDLDALNNSHDANLRKAMRLIAKLPTITAYFWRLHENQEVIAPRDELDTAANFLYMLTGKEPDENAAKMMNTSLILYTEHGFNASTFSARVTASTLSDLYSAIVSAIGTLKGPLHGGANEKAMNMLLKIGKADKAKQWVLDALARKERIMGFGHRVYKHGDARNDIIKKLGFELAKKIGQEPLYELAKIVEDTVREEKGLLPNVDYYSAPAYYILGIPVELYTPIFVMARVVGWSAHVIEQLDNNRLIRPRSEYIGEVDKKYTAIVER